MGRSINIFGEKFALSDEYVKQVKSVFGIMRKLKFTTYVPKPETGSGGKKADDIDLFEANDGWFYRAFGDTYIMIRFSVDPADRRGAYGIAFEVGVYRDESGKTLGEVPDECGYCILVGETSESYDDWTVRIKRKIGIAFEQELEEGSIFPDAKTTSKIRKIFKISD